MNSDEPSQTASRRNYFIASGIVVAVGAMLLAPVDYPGRLLGVVFDYGHVPLFATLTFAVIRLVGGREPFETIGPSRLGEGERTENGGELMPSPNATASDPPKGRVSDFGREPSLRLAIAVALAAVLFGVGGEVLQKYVGRSTEVGDAIANAVGAAIGFFAATWRRWSSTQRRAGITILVVGLTVAFWSPTRTLIDIYNQRHEFPMLGSFESSMELSRWHTRKAVKKRSREHATDGEWSLMCRFKPAEYSELHIRWPFGDWAKYQTLELDVWNDEAPGSDPIVIVVKVEDTHHNGQHEDRFQQECLVPPGQTTLSVPVRTIEAAPSDRKMDLQLIARVSLFTMNLKRDHVLYFDRLQLTGRRRVGTIDGAAVD